MPTSATIRFVCRTGDKLRFKFLQCSSGRAKIDYVKMLASLVQITASIGTCLPESMVRIGMTDCTGYVASMMSVGEVSAVWQLVRRGVFVDTDINVLVVEALAAL
ncbi:unnamed protein product [Taenia asiatica]|uniref:PK_Tyr_Ser-Thr domain-containing protein n=1 Tax=Taenia asiatica TaxID=60517 RepID=A0A0R3VTD6_TAEAS|nr:unnamed protein product [Taenia asiatica]